MESKHTTIEDKRTSGALSDISNDIGILAEPASNSFYGYDKSLYRQDVVRHKRQEGLLGVVMEVAGDSDTESSTTDDNDIDDRADENNTFDCLEVDDTDRNGEVSDGNKDDTLSDGQARIIWTDGSETTDNVNDIAVVDRGFLHGDIVASGLNPTGQLGLVVDVNIMVDLQTCNGEVIHNVSTKDLKRIREFSIGDYAVLGPWLGRVNDVLDNVTVLFDDGSVCKVVKANPLKLKAVSRDVIDEEDCPYYPGQRVRAVSSKVFKGSRWLSGIWKASRIEGTVVKVQTASVMVYWLSSAYLGVGTASSDVPSEEQNPNDLTMLSCFSYAKWQLGDWCLLQLPIANMADKSDIQPTMDECDSTCPEESLMDDSSFYDLTPKNRSMEQVGEASNLPKDCQPFDTDSMVLSVDNKNNMIADTLSHEVMGVRSKKLVAVINSSDFQLHDNDSVNQGEMAWESNPTNTIEVIPECGSCAISSSTSREHVHDGWPAYRKKLRKVLFKREKKACKKDETFERALLIINTVTKVDVAWQDGTRECGLESTSLVPVQNPNDQEFYPEQYVVEKASNEIDDLSELNRVGIVRSVNSKERTACIRWFKPVSSPEDPREFSCDEVVSVYELDVHPDYEYCYGDVVVRLSPVSAPCSVLEIYSGILREEVDMAESEAAVTKQHSEHELELSNGDVWKKFKSLSWVGNITGLQDGDIEVSWADGMVSKVGPQAVYVVGREDDSDSYEGGIYTSDDGASWETVNENELNILDVAEEEANSQSANNILTCENTEDITSDDAVPVKTGVVSLSVACISFVAKLVTGLFSRNRKDSDLSNSDNNVLSDSRTQNVPAFAVNHTTEANLDISVHQNHLASTGDSERMVSVPNESLMLSAANSNRYSQASLHSFKHFDVSDSPADHHFLSSTEQGNGGRKWAKKIQQEWSILEKNLPDAIYVVVYEDRIDLLRAVIVGASGTPYQDGLFFFDFYFPPEYPQVPPVAYYHSGGLRLNPNLYAEGKVCLSLLNTWAGRGNEVWNPSSSSILQVLVSLQGLVLNSKPYFNEAGYEKQVGTLEGEKNSVPYNENTYLLNLKSMMYLMRRPPAHFEAYVKDHFQRRGHYILKACEAYMGGCLIGTLTKDACPTEESKEQLSSVGFKLMLSKILPRLISALAESGADTHQFEHLIKPEIHQ